MNNNEFCHLHVHNEYSLLDGYGTAEAYVKRAKNLGFDYLALTNHANIDGLIQFQKACNKFRSEYSLLDGYGTAEAYVKRAKNLGFDYLALTNHANIDGLIQFQKACNKF